MWQEITDGLRPGQVAADNPALTARVFKLKRARLNHLIKNRKVFGRTKMRLNTVEYQGRGLPHDHGRKLTFLPCGLLLVPPITVEGPGTGRKVVLTLFCPALRARASGERGFYLFCCSPRPAACTPGAV